MNAGKTQGEHAPLRIAKQGWFYVGGHLGSGAAGAEVVGQMYVEYQLPVEADPASGGHQARPPLVFVHGGRHTGACWQGTPDGRPGWPDYFLSQGWPIYVVDQPARGRSPDYPGEAGRMTLGPSVPEAQEKWACSEKTAEPGWSQAKLHSRWPGGAEPGDVAFDQYYAQLSPDLVDSGLQEDLTTEGLVALLDRIGPAILIPHSQPGPAVWRVTDLRPQLVSAIVALEPSGPAFYERGKEGGPRARPYGPSRGPLTYDPPIVSAGELSPVRQQQPDGPDLATCWLQAEPARQLPRLKGRPILFLLSESSYHAPYDHGTSLYLKQAGVDNELVRLADLGIHGNGHLMMIEDNSLELAAWVERWLLRHMSDPRWSGLKKIHAGATQS